MSHAVQYLSDLVNAHLEKGELAHTVYADFRKAFNTEDFNILFMFGASEIYI